MQDTASDFLNVRSFHSKFEQPTDMPTADGLGIESAALMPEDQFTFRRKFLFEEFDEYSVAFNKGNLIKAADSLFDLQYVIFGTALFMRAGLTYFAPRGWPTYDFVRGNAFGLGLLNGAPSRPRLLTPAAHNVIHELIGGQLTVFDLTHRSGEPNAAPFALAALWNLSYNVYLTACLMGVPWKECWTIVHDANMTKVRAQRDGSDSARGSGWDVVKPVGWEAPDYSIAFTLKQAGADIPLEYMEDAKKTSQPKQ